MVFFRVNHHLKWDKLGIGLSVLCLIHCLVLPFVFVLAPWIDDIFHFSHVHELILILAGPLAIYSLYGGSLDHKNSQNKPLYLGLVGISFLILGLWFEDLHFFHEQNHGALLELVDHFFSILGSLFLFSAHLLNIRKCLCSHS